MKKLGLLGFILLFSSLLTWGFQSETARITHIEVDETYSLPLESIASSENGTALYQNKTTFVSEIYEVGDFHLLALGWMQELPDPSEVLVEVEVFQDGVSLGWMPLEVDHDAEALGDQTYSTLIIEGDAFRYRVFLLTGDPSLTPKLSEITIDAIYGGETAPVSQMSMTLNRLIFSEDYEIIPREDWGADPDYLVYEPEDEDDLPDEEEELPEDVYRIEYYDEEERPLIWPVSYSQVDGIVLHHTVTGGDPSDYPAVVRAIYLYHSQTLGWGDIGYNYIVDPNGVIYEGRYGGSEAVGGHTAGYNEGTVGIALIGNYEEEIVSEAAMASVTRLVYEFAKIFDLDPLGKRTDNGKQFPVISGHLDYGGTSCPGDHFYIYIEQIRGMVADTLENQSATTDDDTFDYKESGESAKRALIGLRTGQTETVVLTLENTGESTWTSETYLQLIDNEWEESLDLSAEGDILASLKESQVEPGETGTFEFQATGLPHGNLVYLPVRLVYNGTKESNSIIDIGFYVPKLVLDFDILEVEVSDEKLNQGESTEVTVSIENTGDFTWTNSGDYPLVLEQVGSSTLSTETVLALMQESEVAPSETAHFNFTLEAPYGEGGGTHTLYFQPTLQNSDALVSSSGQVSVTVQPSAEDLVSSVKSDLTLTIGEEETLWIEIENLTDEDWNQTGWNAFRLDVLTPNGLQVTTPQLQVSEFNSGDQAKLYFTVTVSEDATPGEVSLIFWPRVNRANITPDPYILHLTLEAADEEPEVEEPEIRILLTPEGTFTSHLLSVDEDYGVYSGDDLLFNLGANELVRVTLEGEIYMVSSDDYEEEVEGPVRIISEVEGALVTVHTVTDAASWDTSLVYNIFRGKIELREYEGELALINELPLEDYILGLAEVGATTHTEKMRVMAIISRTYALWYILNDQKFPEVEAQLSDSPEDSQKYLGYAFESRMDNWVEAVEATSNMVITYEGEVVKTPYFSATDGTYTFSAEDKWGWTDTPYLVSVSDSYCTTSDAFSGHGVGLSGCGAEGMAQNGFTFEEIIEHYYTGVDIESYEP